MAQNCTVETIFAGVSGGAAGAAEGGVCAVITPVGPGHEALARQALSSVKGAAARSPGPFSRIVHILVDDTQGLFGRSRARNLAVREAQAVGADWLFFLDADDLMVAAAFATFARHARDHDAVWGGIAEISPGEGKPHLRMPQVLTMTRLEEVLWFDPFMTLQMGHFVRCAVAAANRFSEEMDTGEDFEYYVRLWERHRCIKVREAFFVNRRGQHSQGPRAADGRQWRENVMQVLRAGEARMRARPAREESAEIVNAKSRELRDHLRRQGYAVGSHYFELSRKMPYRGSLTVDCFASPSFCMFSDNDDLVVCSIFWTGSYETASTALWCKLLGQPGAVLDVGSYTGLYSLLAAAVDPTRVVHAFEPLPGSFDRLRANLAANQFGAVAAYPYAVGEREGEAVFNIFNNGDFLTTGGSLIPRGDRAAAKALSVRVVALDEHWRASNGGKVALVKMDVEGAELPALRGMAGLLDRDGPDLMLEVLDRADGRPLTQFLAEKGYRFFAIDEKSAELQPVESLVGSGRPDDLNRLVTRKSSEELRSRFGIRVAERTGMNAVDG